MKRYNITVNGKAYDVAVEEVEGGAAPVAAAPAAAAPAPTAAPAAAPAPVVPAGPGRMSSGSVNFADEVEGPVAAAILAAVAEELGGTFRVTSIKKA